MSSFDKNRLHIHEYIFELFVTAGEVQLKFPCTFFITWKTGKHITQDIESVVPEGDFIPFNSHLELTSEVAYNQQSQLYLEKRSFISVYLNSLCRNNTPKLVGVVPLDLSQCLNNNTYDKPKSYRIERCPDKQSHLTMYVKSRFSRELGRDEIRDMSFSFQNEIDQQIARRESTGMEPRPSLHQTQKSQADRKSVAFPGDNLVVPPPVKKEHDQQAPAKAVSKDKSQVSRTARQHYRDLAGSIARSHRAQLQQERPNSIRASFKKSSGEPTGQDPKVSIRGSNRCPSQTNEPHSKDPTHKSEREQWISKMQSTVINRRNQLKDSVLKDYMNRHQQESQELKQFLESQKNFRLKLQAELESVRIECTKYKAANKELQKKWQERPPEQEPNVIRKLRDQLNESEKKMLQANETIDVVTLQLKRVSSDNESLKTTIGRMKSLEDQASMYETVQRELNSVREKFQLLQQEKVKVDRQLEAVRNTPTTGNNGQLAALHAQMDVARRQLATEKDTNFQLMRETAKTSEQLGYLEAELSQLNDTLNQTVRQKRELEQSGRLLAQTIRNLEQRLKETEEVVSVRDQTITELTRDIEKLINTVESQSKPQEGSQEDRLQVKLDLYQKNTKALQETLKKSEQQRNQLKDANSELRKQLLQQLNNSHENELAYDRNVETLKAEIEMYRSQVQQVSEPAMPVDVTEKASLPPAVAKTLLLVESVRSTIYPQPSAPAEYVNNDKGLGFPVEQISQSHYEISETKSKEVLPPPKMVTTLVEIQVQTDGEPLVSSEPKSLLAIPKEPLSSSQIVSLPRDSLPPTITLEQHNTKIQEYQLRIIQLEKCLQKIGELHEQNIELQLQTDSYQQEAWSLRSSLENEMVRSSNMQQTIQQLKGALDILQKRQQQQERSFSISSTKDELEQLKVQVLFLTNQTNSDRLVIETLREELANAEVSSNELFERLQEKDDKERLQEESIRQLEQKLFDLQHVQLVNSPVRSPAAEQEVPGELLDTSVVLQKTDFKSLEAAEQPFFEEPPSPTRIINQPNAYQDHPAIKLNPLLSQIHILAKRLSTTSKQIEQTTTERDDRQLIVKYLEDQVGKLHKQLKKQQEEIFKAQAEVSHGQKHRTQLQDKLSKIENKNLESISKALSVQMIEAQMENRRLGDKLRRANTMVGADVMRSKPSVQTQSCHDEQQVNEPIKQESIKPPSQQHELHLELKEKGREIEVLHQEIARKLSEGNSKDLRIEELADRVQSLEGCLKEYEEMFGSGRGREFSPVHILESPKQTETSERIQEELAALRKEREVYIRIIEETRKKELKGEVSQAELDQIRSDNEQLRRECSHLERVNSQLRSELDLMRQELLSSRMTLSPIVKPPAESFQQGGVDWQNQTNGLHQLLVTLTTRNRLLMQRLRALSIDREAFEVGVRHAMDELKRLTARLLMNTANVQQKRQAMKQMQPLSVKLNDLLQIVGSGDPALLIDESQQSMQSAPRSQF